jgi:formylglycine-generating enzyme required for sulfatase activity
MSDIFISYKREEQPEARKLADALEREGWEVWWDPKLRAGDDFDRIIEAILNESRCVIVLWSEMSVQSDYVLAEATEALEKKKLMPVAIEKVTLPFRFKRLHTLQLVNWDGSSESVEFRKLVENISGRLGKPETHISRAQPVPEGKPPSFEGHYREQRKTPGAHITGLKPPVIIGLSVGAVALLILIVLVKWLPVSVKQEPVLSAPSIATSTPAPTRKEPLIGEASKPVVVPQTKRITSSLTPGAVFRDPLKIGSEGPEMVVVPAGTFQMGDVQGDGERNEQPVHAVRIQKPFAIGRYEITFDDYDRFTKATGWTVPKDGGWGRARHPVINVSWQEVQIYLKWLLKQTGKRYRLPSEAEWEYAARSGGKDEKWSGTSDVKQLPDYAVFRQRQTEPVGSKKPNGLGLYDMSGNVFEWVEDCSHSNYNGAPSDGYTWGEENGGSCNPRMIRGGSWTSLAMYLRTAYRRGYFQAFGSENVGFRLVQDLP